MDEFLSVLWEKFRNIRGSGMTNYIFTEISTKRTKRWKDKDGKKRQVTKKFYQTLNPFNKNKNGSVKNESEIWKEINEEADSWMKEAVE